MNRKERVAHLADRIIGGVAKTAQQEWDNASDYVVDEAQKIGAADDEIREAADAAQRAIEGFLRRRIEQREAMRKRRRR